ncbi:endo alpha-1,4 polygalactosaminidase [Flavobacterium sp.]|uniref:endo alpha-1,4 polygalactosaminidase n=1 Tax=Flavobacterium sp. TaxID=239 RepID=UPI0035285C66
MKKLFFFLCIALPLLLLLGFEMDNKDKNTLKAGKKMQEMVVDISKYARKFNPDFIIIPQNGSELAFQNVNPEKPLCNDYINAIDGIAIEELFYDENGKADDYRINNLKKIPKDKKVIVSEFVKEKNDEDRIVKLNREATFVPFIRTADNYHYHIIPEKILNENSNNITKLPDVQNFLYLINADDFDTKKDLIDRVAETNFDLILIDLYYLSFPYTKTDLEKLKVKKNGGKRLVICYLNIGAAENWRSYWQPDWKKGNPKWLKKNYKGYDNEIYVEFWEPTWQKIIFGNDNSYTKKIIDAGFDGVFLDNVEAYYALYN